MFSPSLHLIFSFSYKHLLKTEVFNFDEVQFTQLLTECVFVIVLRNLCPTQRNFGCDGSGHYLDCSTVYTNAYKVTKIFCHFCLEVLWFYGTGVSMIHFRWIFVYNLWRYGLKFLGLLLISMILLFCIQIVSHNLLKRLSFLSETISLYFC